MSVDSVNGSTPTTNTNPTSATKSDAASASLDYDAFLNLLVAQMKYQDPLNPMDSSEYMSQFATFSNVEQAIKTNTKLDSLLNVSALTQAGSVIGLTATSGDGSVTGTVTAVKITSDGATAILNNGKTLVLDSGVEIAYPTTAS
ncbi:flagellar hook assembly protein FlgD [Mangrovibrevibacter kandeliae]|uniref:flagellar hook assembly protein FlgD n=1 Tax=Mangrovibrevibacter kandeliae TaxID=2968473 RepID=UPI00211812E3|nr:MULTISPECIES: flagellar hook assembly protein FlgD [unclassified Aurantimonas]MCQ8780937.1 flagellar hook assembly protein FlgD [Aurantimonas sp. CSK15Z-1]MCW4113718.1 flagellar hook assembly protein FlgD [Aurantimonas sp. MSK8Z-1]